MTKQLLRILTISLLLGSSAMGQKISPAKLDPAPSTPAQEQIINEGIALHDQGLYDRAISRYEQVLKENPRNVLAMYEMAYSYFQKRDYRKSLEISNQAIQYKSDLLPRFYTQIGSCLDEL